MGSQGGGGGQGGGCEGCRALYQVSLNEGVGKLKVSILGSIGERLMGSLDTKWVWVLQHRGHEAASGGLLLLLLLHGA